MVRTLLYTLVAMIGMFALDAALRADDLAPVARWNFGAEESSPLLVRGGVQRDQAGPRPPEFPEFAADNTAVYLDGKGARFEIADRGPGSPFDFTNGDAITLEAWVHVAEPRNASPMYVIGKGRTGQPQFARDNQNWALRIVANRGVAKLSFLFATAPSSGTDHWHRWTSALGFKADSGWHHVAVTYRFGEPESIRGWIDGRPTDGTWDMGGPTTDPPVVDDDAVWVGSSQGGSLSNSFRGWLDAVAVYRTTLDDKAVASRFRRVGGPRTVGPRPEAMPELGAIPSGRILFTISEGLPAHDRWLNEGEAEPRESARWLGQTFLLPRIPQRYDAWGIRDRWKAPVLLRIAADVELPDGSHRFLVRARALGRLWIDGQLVSRTEPITQQPPNGEEPITPLARPPLPGVRVAGYHQQEVISDHVLEAIATPAGGNDSDPSAPRRRVVLELVVGGTNLRTETGEICVARQTTSGESFEVLRASGDPLPLTDEAIEPVLAQIETFLRNLDDQTRRTASSSQDAFWEGRHQVAREWAARWDQAPTQPPGEGHPIDRFIAAKIERAVADSAGVDRNEATYFYGQVLPILRDHCFRCHGEKEKGGLKLDRRASAVRGGDSEIPAIVPGDPTASELIARVRTDDEGSRMPPTGLRLQDDQIAILEQWIKEDAAWPARPVSDAEAAFAPLLGDEAFLRRVYLDTVGVPPTAEAARAFLADRRSDKRERWIDVLLEDERFADHWVSYWLDLLAENPALLNQALNSSGPFRWFLYDALRDRKSFDRLVTELLLMRGDPYEGGSAGFAMAAENDSPFAAKGHIVASAFLGIELQCARCHDSPYHSTTQRDLYSLAAMFERKSTKVPVTSRVPSAFFEQNKARESLIRVTLKLDESVEPRWPFAETTGVEDGPHIDRLMQSPEDSRERLAALITAPQNVRFSRVLVNRLWKQLMGAGLVESVHDWEGQEASHPQLLDWLAGQLASNGYDIRHILRLILTSDAYQRSALGRNQVATPARRFFVAPDRRRLTAEQIVDSLHVATGQAMDVEELSFVHDGRRPISNRLSLGRPRRAWMLAGLNNERDRPSLSLPRARTVADVLEAFGWTGTRQQPVSDRDTEPNLLQPGVLANGTLTMRLTRAAHESQLAEWAVTAKSADSLVEDLFLRVLTRRPVPAELAAFSEALQSGFDTRLLPAAEIQAPEFPPPLPLVTWFNHLQPESNTIQQEHERRIRRGPPPDPRLRTEWREVYEDFVWSLLNHREFVWMP